MRDGLVRPRPVKLDRGVEGLQRGEAAHIADEDSASRPQDSGGPVQHFQKVVDVREILDDGVEDDRVEGPGFESVEILRRPLEQNHVRQPARRAEPPHPVQRVGREVCGPILFAVGGDSTHQQAGAAADFEDAPRPQLDHPPRRLVHPLPHLLGGYLPARVAAPPPGDVEGGVPALALPRRVRLVPRRTPLPAQLPTLPLAYRAACFTAPPPPPPPPPPPGPPPPLPPPS